jgi:hypothetical protein
MCSQSLNPWNVRCWATTPAPFKNHSGILIELEMSGGYPMLSSNRRCQPQQLGSNRHQPRGGSKPGTEVRAVKLGCGVEGLEAVPVSAAFRRKCRACHPAASARQKTIAAHLRHKPMESLSMAIVRS